MSKPRENMTIPRRWDGDGTWKSARANWPVAAKKPKNDRGGCQLLPPRPRRVLTPTPETSCLQILLCVYCGHTSHTELGTHHVSCQQGRHEWERLREELRNGLFLCERRWKFQNELVEKG